MCSWAIGIALTGIEPGCCNCDCLSTWKSNTEVMWTEKQKKSYTSEYNKYGTKIA